MSCAPHASFVDAGVVTSHHPSYSDLILEAAPRLLGQLDREPLSPTYGSFDRDHWSWKFRDFPLVMMQTGLLPLSSLYARALGGNSYFGNPELLASIEGGIDSLLARQHRNGAFDTVGPNTQDHGVTLSMVYTLSTLCAQLGGNLAPDRRIRMVDAVDRACRFAGRSSEDYSFISNHQALFAIAWLRASALLGDAALMARADDTITEIIAQQSVDGWYREYGGPDPGYESLGIHYLALFRQARATPELDASLARAVDFYANFVAPDGSVGGGYGSRNTHLWYPGGFELLAPQLPMAAAVAGFLRARLGVGNVVTLRNVDAQNLPTLMASYCTAVEAIANSPEIPLESPLPCSATQPLRVFSDSGLAVVGTPHYRAVANLRKGGMLVVFDRDSGRILHEDAGYVIQATGHDWTTALIASPDKVEQSAAHVQITTAFLRANREVLTPFKFLILRALNLTLFRSVWLGALIRNMIISQIITGRKVGPYRVTRRIDFADDHVTVHDEIVADAAASVTAVFRPRTYQAQHMGSARYFHPRELVSIATTLSEAPAELAAQLRKAGRLSLRFVVSLANESSAGVPVTTDSRVPAVPDLTH